MTSKEKQIKNSFIYILPTVIGALLSLLTLSIFTRILTKEDYGYLALAQIYGIFMTGLFNFGMLLAYERDFFENKETKKASELLYSTLLFVGISFLVAVFFTYLFKIQISKLVIGTSEQASLLFWVFCSTGILSFKQYYLTYFKNTENAKAFVWYTIDESILGVLFSLFLVGYMRIGIFGLVWGQMSASLVILVVLALKFHQKLEFAFNYQVLKNSLKFSYPLTPSLVFKVVTTQFDKYMIGLLGSVGGVGIYSIGQRISSISFIYMTAVQNVFSPQVYKRMFELGENGGESVGKYLTPFAYVSIAVALMIALFAEEVLFVLTPKSYHGAVEIVIILSMLYGIYFFRKQPQLIFARKMFVESFLMIFGVLLNVLINIPFIMKWGAIGAAWGTLLAGLISGIVSFVVSQHYYKIDWEYRKMGLVFLIFFSSAITMILMSRFGIPYGIRMVIKLLAVVGYLYLGMKLNILTKQNYLLVKNMIIPHKKDNYC